jgi:hypothetical protein
MDISAIALQGLAQANAQLNSATLALTNAGANSPDGANLDVVSLSSQIVAQTSAEIQVELSLASLKTADQIQQTAVNLLA